MPASPQRCSALNGALVGALLSEGPLLASVAVDGVGVRVLLLEGVLNAGHRVRRRPDDLRQVFDRRRLGLFIVVL